MKSIYLTLILCFISFFASAQVVKPYLAIVSTNTGKYKGILYKVDSAYILLSTGDSSINVPTSSIRKVLIRSVKKSYVPVNLIKVGSDVQEYKLNSNGKYVDKWGKERPTPAEELGVTFFSIVGTAIANGLALPIHAINPNVNKFRFKGDVVDEKNKFEEVSYYSVFYQTNPNVLAELKKIKQISKQFNP